MLVGRIVDSYTNIMTVKLFAHAEREDAYARAALTDQMSKWQASLRLITGMEMTLYLLNGCLLVGACGAAIWLWTLQYVSIGDIAVVSGLVIRIVAMSGWVMWTIADVFENIGIVHEGMETIARPNLLQDRARRSAVEGAARRDPFRSDSFPLWSWPGGFDGCSAACSRGAVADGSAGRESRARRPLGCRQVDARQPVAALLRRRGRPHSDRRAEHRACHAG